MVENECFTIVINVLYSLIICKPIKQYSNPHIPQATLAFVACLVSWDVWQTTAIKACCLVFSYFPREFPIFTAPTSTEAGKPRVGCGCEK